MFSKQVDKTKTGRHQGVITAASILLAGLVFFFSSRYALAGGGVAITRQFSPSANAAITTNAGDNNGFETNPTGAYADGGTTADDINSGDKVNSTATDIGTDKHNFFNYGLSAIPSGSTINGITVRADISVAPNLNNSPFTAIRLSWNGGTSWTAVKQVTLTSTSETTYNFGGSADTWGRTWLTSELTDANFRVQVINGDMDDKTSNNNFYLDWLPVSITFTAPWDSYSDAARTTISDNFVTFGSTVYMKGTGYPTGTYNVIYYDADINGGQKTATDSNISVTTGVLNSQYLLNSNLGRVGGTWHALVQPTSGNSTPQYYNTAIAAPDTYALRGNDAFTVQQAAIPEFPDVMAGIIVAGSCFGLYYWMRKRRLGYVRA